MKLSLGQMVTIQPEVKLDLQKEMQFWSDRFVARQNGKYITASTDWLRAQPAETLATRYAIEELVLRGAVLQTIKYLLVPRRKLVLQVLEVGIGGGFLTETLLQNPRFNYQGLDISPGIVAYHKQRMQAAYPDIGTRLGFGSVTHLTKPFGFALPESMPGQTIYKHNTFDFVVCGEVLHRVEDWAAAVSEIGNVLKPGGVLLGYEPLRDYNDFSTSPTGAVLKSSSDYQGLSEFHWVSGLTRNITFCGQTHTIYALKRA